MTEAGRECHGEKYIWISLIIGIAGPALGCLAGFAIGQSSTVDYRKALQGEGRARIHVDDLLL
jgi:hypothetical protein